CDEDGDGDDQRGDDGGAPVFEKQIKNQNGEDQAEHDGFPDAGDGGADEEGLVVEEGQLHVGRQFVAEAGELDFQLIGDVERASIGLGADVEKDGVDAVGGDDVEDGFLGGDDFGEILDADDSIFGRGDGEIFDVIDRVDPAIDEREVERVIFFVH